MSVYTQRWSSWGRTRQPKNLAGSGHGAEVSPGATALPTADPTLVTDGLATENQRYLHIYLQNSHAGNAKKATVWGWIHAFGKWFLLYDTAGVKVEHTVANGVGTNIYKVHEIDKCLNITPIL